MDCKAVKRLLNKGNAYLGMIREAESKCILLKNKLKNLSSDDDLGRELVVVQINQIRLDLSKYSRILNRVHKELNLYDFSKLE